MVRNQRDDVQSVYTQTYSTADRTVANATATAVGDIGATNGGWGCDSEAHMDSIHTALDALIADVLQLKKVVTALIDDLQEAGVIK
jgi:hypothetical protein